MSIRVPWAGVRGRTVDCDEGGVHCGRARRGQKTRVLG